MIAVTVLSSIGASVSLSIYFGVLLLAGVLCAPPAVKRDKRVIVAVFMVAIFVVLGHGIQAGPWICPYQDIPYLSWLCYVP
jgi:hypothetical protein